MKVSLSASERQLACMAYSSSRDSGSEAVASWIAYSEVRFGFLCSNEEIGSKYWIFHPFVIGWYVGLLVRNEYDFGSFDCC